MAEAVEVVNVMHSASPSGLERLAALFERRRFLLTVGAGGVGKTTTAAAIAVAAAAVIEARVLVLTVDPARRLADALGVDVAAEVHPVSGLADAIGQRPAGELWVSMLDTQKGWTDLIDAVAPDRTVRDAIADNGLFRNLTGRFVHSHGYLAMERLAAFAEQFDIVIVDTPPSRNALDILDAPSKMLEFFGSGLLRWLVAPYRSRLLANASRPFTAIAERILGRGFVNDITEFFVLFQQLAPRFSERVRITEALLRDEAAFVVVTTLEAAPTDEAIYLIDEIDRRQLTLSGVIANKVLPPALGALDPDSAAATLDDVDAASAAEAISADPALIASTMTALREGAELFSSLADNEGDMRMRLAERARRVPIEFGLLAANADDLRGLVEIADGAQTGDR